MTVSISADSTRRPRKIDFTVYKNGTEQQKQETALSLIESIHETGFCRLVNHNVSKDTLDSIFKQTSSFFALPENVKSKVKHPPAFNPHRGWSEIGRETVSTVTNFEKGVNEPQKIILDIKEAFDIGNPDDPLFPNMWLPDDDLPGFRHTMEQFYEECRVEHALLLEALALGCRLRLGVDVDFASLVKDSVSECRVNYYPATRASFLTRAGGCYRISPHTDFGTLTLLFQDDVGGLEIEDQSNYGRFFPVRCDQPCYEILVNAGDVLQRWSNDYFRSVNHQVTLPTFMKEDHDDIIVPARRSVAFFAKPDRHVDVGTMPAFVSPGTAEKYEHMTALDFNQVKLKLTYGSKSPDATAVLEKLKEISA